MFKKYRYSVIGILSIISSAALMLGGIMTLYYSGVIYKMNFFSSKSSFGTMKLTVYLFIFGLAAVLVSAIYQFLYYTFEEKQKAVLFCAISSTLTFCLYIYALNNIISTIISLFSSNGHFSAIPLWIAFIGSIITFLLNSAVVLQMKQTLHLSFLENRVPIKLKFTVMQPIEPVDEVIKEDIESGQKQEAIVESNEEVKSEQETIDDALTKEEGE